MLLILANNIRPSTLRYVSDITFTLECLFYLKRAIPGKRINGSLFDVAMDSFDEEEIRELIGLFLFSRLISIW